MKMVMEKSWNMENWPKVMEFCDSVIEFYKFCSKFGERDGHAESRNGHGKIFYQVYGNPA